MDDAPKPGSGNAEASGKGLLSPFVSCVHRAHLAHGILRNLRSPNSRSTLYQLRACFAVMIRASVKALRICAAVILVTYHGAPTADHISRIFGIGAKQEVIGICASSIIAKMTDDQAIGKRTIRNEEGDSVSVKLFLEELHASVPSLITMSRPHPASGQPFAHYRTIFIDVLPKIPQLAFSEVDGEQLFSDGISRRIHKTDLNLFSKAARFNRAAFAFPHDTQG